MNLTKSQRLTLVICISSCFFLAEISVGFYTRSLALVADAFHYLNDLIGFSVALVAIEISRKKESPRDLSFGWQRAQLLGAFFNGVFLVALGVSIFLQSIERFVSIEIVEEPKLVLIIGCIGLGLNLISATFLHEHDHPKDDVPGYTERDVTGDESEAYPLHASHRHANREPPRKGHDLGLLGALIHVLGDAFNNIGVIISALVIWLTDYPGRYYADPAVSVAIAIMILVSSIHLVRKSGMILLESVPTGIDLSDVKHDIERIPGVQSAHELHVWRLNQEKSLASVHVAVSDCRLSDFMGLARTMGDCFHSYGIHSATVQPELSSAPLPEQRRPCQTTCGIVCREYTCCG